MEILFTKLVMLVTGVLLMALGVHCGLNVVEGEKNTFQAILDTTLLFAGLGVGMMLIIGVFI